MKRYTARQHHSANRRSTRSGNHAVNHEYGQIMDVEKEHFVKKQTAQKLLMIEHWLRDGGVLSIVLFSELMLRGIWGN